MRPDKVCETTEEEDDEAAFDSSGDVVACRFDDDDDGEGNNVRYNLHRQVMMAMKIPV